MVLAEVVRQEVETNLLSRASSFGEKEARRLMVEGFLASALPVEGNPGKAVVSKLKKVQEYALD